MPAKPKTKVKKKTKSKTAVTSRKNDSAKKRMAKKAGRKKPAVKTKAIARKTIPAKTKSRPKKKVQEKSQSVDTLAFSVKRPGVRSGRQSGDLQGLSDLQGADSESVAELLEEGNPFEAGDLTRIRRVQQGSQAPRIQLRRFYGYLCAHAGGRHSERSSCRLFPISRNSADRLSGRWPRLQEAHSQHEHCSSQILIPRYRPIPSFLQKGGHDEQTR